MGMQVLARFQVLKAQVIAVSHVIDGPCTVPARRHAVEALHVKLVVDILVPVTGNLLMAGTRDAGRVGVRV